MDSSSVAAWVSLARKGDADAFAHLYSLVYLDLYRYAFYVLGNSADAEDAVQDAVLSAYKDIGSLKNAEAFKSWMFTILARTCKGHIKKRIKNRQPLNDPQPLITEGFDQQLLQADTLRRAILTLPPKSRIILLLSIKGGFNSADIGKMLNLPSSTVRSTLSRCCTKLKELLKEDSHE